MLLFPIGFFYACFMVASKRIAAVAAQGKCSFPWDGIGLAHKRQLRFHRAVCKTAISPERCIIAPYFIGGSERSAFREHHAPSLQAPARLPVDGTRSSKVPSRPFLVALMHFNPADKLVENGGCKVGKGGMAFRQLQKLLRPSSRVLISG